MGRQKADTADKFPWDKYFSGVQSQYEDAIEYCTAVRTSADTVRKAVIVLGISDTGDTQMMYPEEEYEFDGEKVTEYPMAKNGLRQEQKGLVNLDQLTNFTNYNTKQPGGWLDTL